MGLKILVVDDDPSIRRLTRAILMQQGYEVETAENGEEALEKAGENIPDLIILDIMMPGLDGYQTCDKLRTDTRFTHLPIMFLSAKSEIEDKVKGYDQGADEYFTKPFRKEELIAKVKAILRRKTMHDKAREQAVTDGLTTLYNRRYFDRRLQDEFARVRRYERTLAITLIDIDHFKEINDQMGHQVGDTVLKQVSETLMKAARETDILCRYGGDELAVIMPETDLFGATQAAERFRERCEAMLFGNKEQTTQVTLSCGISAYPESPALTSEQLLEFADSALYQAKRAGRNRVIAWDSSKVV